MTTRRLRISLIAGIAALLLVAWSQAAHAQTTLRYAFDLTKLELPDEAAELEEMVRKMVKQAIDEHPELLPGLPSDCPSPTKAPKRFRKYLEKKKMRAYRVNVKVTSYAHTVEPNPKKSGHLLGTEVALHFFGEEIHPERVMAFTGEGSAGIKMEVGKKVRPRDKEFADREAFDKAIKDAIAASLKKLETDPPPKVEAAKTRRKKRKPRKKK